MTRLSRLLIFALAALCCAPCFAHKQSDSYLTLAVNGAAIEGRWDIALRDLDFAIGLDANGDGRITWGETRRRSDAVWQYALHRLQIQSADKEAHSSCSLRAGDLLIDEHVDGAYAVLRFDGECPGVPARIGVAYSLLDGLDPNHRGLLDVRGSAGNALSQVLINDASPAWLPLDAAPIPWLQLRSFVVEGIRHLWLGFDHILFLLTLLLPAVRARQPGHWYATASLRDSLVEIVKVVSAFTLAHSITLSLATLGLVNLPTRFVESTIAFTVMLGALNLLYPVINERRWLMALGFGLIHGLGFASVLGDLGLSDGNLAAALIGFNIGVELGQLTVVLALMPLVFVIRETVFYRRLLLPAGAIAIACLSAYWAVTRAFPDVADLWL